MFSPPSSPSVLASTSRHNIIQPRPPSQLHQQKSLRLFLGHQSDEEEAASDCDLDICCYPQYGDDDSDIDDTFLGNASGSASNQRLQPGRLTIHRKSIDASISPNSPTRIKAPHCVSDGHRAGLFRLPSPSRRPLKRSSIATSPKKSTILAAAKNNSAAIPTTPTKRQKGFLVRGNVTPSRAFSIFKAAKQRNKQRQQHGLMTPPSSSPLRPIILDSFDDSDSDDASSSPSRLRQRRSNVAALPQTSARSLQGVHAHIQSIQNRSAHSLPATKIKESAFGEVNGVLSPLPQSLHSMRTRQPVFTDNGLLAASRPFSATRTPTIDTTAFLETFVSPSSCIFQIPRSTDDEILSHPICAAYSYSSRSVNPTAQWLAVGDDEGRITLLDTLPWQDASAESFTTKPQWQASSSSAIFELVWRFDDRSILSGASDFSIRSWDTEYLKCTGRFQGHRGSPRTIVYDPTTNGDGGCGMVFASAGRDGTIRIWDARTSSRSQMIEADDEDGDIGITPVLTIDAAHNTVASIAAAAGSKGRKQRLKATVAVGRGRKRLPTYTLPAGITALAYLADGQGHKLLSGGSANGIIKCWDLRHVRQSQPSTPVSEVDTHKSAEPPISSAWDTPDVSLLAPVSSFARAHGVSQIISSSTNLYASCTGGNIYSLPLSTFLDSCLIRSEVQTLYDPVQCQNTLFSRMALFDDRFLAVGCNTGNVALWDVTTPRLPNEDAAMGRDVEEERRAARHLDVGFAVRSQQRGMAALTEGHSKNTEVNAVAWANGPNGPTLSSVGDDTKIRTWFADRMARQSIVQAADE